MPSTAPPVLHPANSPSPPGRRTHSRRARPRRPALLSGYAAYLGYFVGAGLISGAVVHHPLDPARYTMIGAAGAALFLIAAVATELQQPGRISAGRLLVVLGSSLALSFGIGMLSGGLQHFEDFPTRAAMLVPSGLLLSFLAYSVKEAERPFRRIFGLPGLLVLVASLLAFGGLRQVAAGLGEPAGGHGHSHGGAESEEHEAEEHGAEEHEASVAPSAPAATSPSAVPTLAPSPAPTPSPVKTGHDADGHTH